GVVLGAFSGAPYSSVAAGAPATVTAPFGTPQSTAVNTNFQVVLVAYVRDANTNGVQGVTVTFRAPQSGPTGTFSGGVSVATSITDQTGVAPAPTVTANGLAGSFVVTAEV